RAFGDDWLTRLVNTTRGSEWLTSALTEESPAIAVDHAMSVNGPYQSFKLQSLGQLPLEDGRSELVDAIASKVASGEGLANLGATAFGKDWMQRLANETLDEGWLAATADETVGEDWLHSLATGTLDEVALREQFVGNEITDAMLEQSLTSTLVDGIASAALSD